MSKEFLGDRAKALEESFFHKKNEQLLEKLREELKTKEQKDALAAASGLRNDKVLTDLLANGIQSETFAALSLVPLVVVAWADGEIQDEERTAIMDSAVRAGIHSPSACYDLLQQWLDHEPPTDLLKAWKEYVHSLRDTLDEEAALALKHEVIGRARHVAQAAGGILGIHKIAASEQAVLNDLEHAFS